MACSITQGPRFSACSTRQGPLVLACSIPQGPGCPGRGLHRPARSREFPKFPRPRARPAAPPVPSGAPTPPRAPPRPGSHPLPAALRALGPTHLAGGGTGRWRRAAAPIGLEDTAGPGWEPAVSARRATTRGPGARAAAGRAWRARAAGAGTGMRPGLRCPRLRSWRRGGGARGGAWRRPAPAALKGPRARLPGLRTPPRCAHGGQRF